MNHSLINSNWLRAFNSPMHDNPFYTTVFGIEEDEAFIPFTSKEVVIIFELLFPTVWEEQDLPVVFITGDQRDPINADIVSRTRYQAELSTNKYLTSGMNQMEIAETRKVQG